jgi:hypothetical protein
MDGESLQDLRELVDLANHGALPCADPGVVVFIPAALTPAPLPGGGEGGEEELELLGLVTLAQQVPQRSFEHRSSDLLAHARLQKERKRHRELLHEESTAKMRAQETLKLIAYSHTNVAMTLGLSRQRLQDPHVQALLHVKLACKQKIRGLAAQDFQRTQDNSCRLVTHCCLDLQAQFAKEFMVGSAAVLDSPHRVLRRIVACSAQWDETSQHLATMPSQKIQAKTSKGQVGVQVMMMSGSMHVARQLRSNLGVPSIELSMHPFLAPATRLDAQDADHILAGMLRGLPFDLLDISQMHDITRANEAFLVNFSSDRAASNYVVVKWVCSHVHKNLGGLPIFIHVEPCALHGVALVKSRAPSAKNIVSALHSFSRWVRIEKNISALTDRMSEIITSSLKVRRAQRPPEIQQRGLKVIELLYGDLQTSEYLWRIDKRTQRKVKTRLHEELEALIGVVDFAGKGGAFVHWNYVEESSDDHRILDKPVGSSVCSSREESATRVAIPLLNFLVGRSWVTFTESRWTSVFCVLRRFTIGLAANRVLKDGLCEIKANFGLDGDDVEKSLEKLVQMDRSDYSAKNRLRLLRIVKTLCNEQTLWILAIMTVTLAPVEALQYALLGHRRNRASLSDLVHPTRSPIAIASGELLDLAIRFEDDRTSKWQLLSLLGGDLGNAEVRRASRKHLLQLSAGLTEIFELRLSQAPYRLAWLAYDEIQTEAKREIAKEFIAGPTDCASYWCRQLKVLCPTVEDLQRKKEKYMPMARSA